MTHFYTQQIAYLRPKAKELKKVRVILAADKLIKETRVYDFFRVLSAPVV